MLNVDHSAWKHKRRKITTGKSIDDDTFPGEQCKV